MANEDFVLTLPALQDAIQATIAAQFPDFLTVEFDRDDEAEGMLTPACLLQLDDAETDPANDGGSGQFPVTLRFSARVIMAHDTPATSLNAARAALALAGFLNLRHFGHGLIHDKARVITTERDEFAPQQDRSKVWRVEFIVPCHLGENAWKNDGTVPTDVRFSWSPDIGEGNAHKYQPIGGSTYVPPGTHIITERGIRIVADGEGPLVSG